MLIELKRCSAIGNIEGILFLVSIIAGKEKISKNEIQNRCALEKDIIINCSGAIAFLEYLKLIAVESDVIIPSLKLNVSANKNTTIIIKDLVSTCISRLAEDGILDKNITRFDVEKNCFKIKKSAFPLEYAAIRNFLTTTEALGKEENGEIYIPVYYEPEWIMQFRNRKKITQSQLLKNLEEQNKRGLEAEKFVLEIERQRLPKKAGKIKRISDFDISAGYDIVSYVNNNSMNYDRFIEVKCYIGTPHFFMSENELEVSKIKLDKYILCLVDYTRITEPGYSPEYIINPYESIFNSDGWLIDATNYRIQKL